MDIILHAFIKSLSISFPNILEKLNVAEVTRNEIDSMEAQKIEEVFYKIAGKYFNKLIKYGFLGVVFGINGVLGVSLGGIYSVKKLLEGKKLKK